MKRDRGDARDIVRSPAILEFAGLDATLAYAESDLQAALVKHLGKFMMELGRGFCLEREQRPIPIAISIASRPPQSAAARAGREKDEKDKRDEKDGWRRNAGEAWSVSLAPRPTLTFS